MSVQTNCEMLSIQAMEAYAKKFHKSEMYKTLQETENGLWAESAEYIADRYYEEEENNQVTV